ncbi:hypothetical protein GCM10010421_00920 [Streptomyces glaucus]|uniref:Secreted protein n=1 Tax=Streptomyces glaucus TaxID=284029 RepID=A0ABP5W4P4_9ACTN
MVGRGAIRTAVAGLLPGPASVEPGPASVESAPASVEEAAPAPELPVTLDLPGSDHDRSRRRPPYRCPPRPAAPLPTPLT